MIKSSLRWLISAVYAMKYLIVVISATVRVVLIIIWPVMNVAIATYTE